MWPPLDSTFQSLYVYVKFKKFDWQLRSLARRSNENCCNCKAIYSTSPSMKKVADILVKLPCECVHMAEL